MALQVYTASLLKEGLVAYLCLDEEGISWTTDVKKATAASEDQFETLKAAAERSEKENIVVGIYAVDVELTDAGLVPTENRERIRANGPTIRLPQNGATYENLNAA